MGIHLSVSTCSWSDEGIQSVGKDIIEEQIVPLGSALEKVNYMFGNRANVRVVVNHMNGRLLEICYEYHINFEGEVLTEVPDTMPVGQYGFIYKLTPDPYTNDRTMFHNRRVWREMEIFNQLLQMVAAYLLAFPELRSRQVDSFIKEKQLAPLLAG